MSSSVSKKGNSNSWLVSILMITRIELIIINTLRIGDKGVPDHYESIKYDMVIWSTENNK